MQHLGLISFLLIATGLVFTVVRWPAGVGRTFSQHAAATRWSAVYYSSLFVVTLPLLYAFLALWFAPTFGLGQWFIVIAALSIAAQIMCTFFPEVGGWRTRVHRIITGISGVLMLPLMTMIAFSQEVPLVGRTIAAVSLAGMLALLVIAVRHQQGYRYALYLQIGYYALFFATIFVTTYLS